MILGKVIVPPRPWALVVLPPEDMVEEIETVLGERYQVCVFAQVQRVLSCVATVQARRKERTAREEVFLVLVFADSKEYRSDTFAGLVQGLQECGVLVVACASDSGVRNMLRVAGATRVDKPESWRKLAWKLRV